MQRKHQRMRLGILAKGMQDQASDLAGVCSDVNRAIS
jgi:hypothetical protein